MTSSSPIPELIIEQHSTPDTAPETVTTTTLEKRTDPLEPSASTTSPASSRPLAETKRHPKPTTLSARLAPISTSIVIALVFALLAVVVGLKTSPRFASFASDKLASMSTTTAADMSTAPSAVTPSPSTPPSVTPPAGAIPVAPSGVPSPSTTYTPAAASSSSGSAPPKAAEAEPAFKFKGDFGQWNRLADSMDRFHGHFRWEYKNVYDNAEGGFKKRSQNLARFLREAEQLAHHLDMHHRIEEAYIFPLLAKKMPQFKDGGRDKGAHIKAHKGIHDGLERYQAYINQCKADPDAYDGEKLRGIMDSFHDVLFNHLDEEVKDLGAESVQKAGFTLDELKRFPM